MNQYFPPDEAATAQLLGDVAAAAASRRWHCTVITSNRSYADPARKYASREIWNDVQVVRVSTSGFGRNSTLGRLVDYSTYVFGTLLAAARERDPSLVVGLSTPPILGALATVVARIHGARSVYWAMDVYPDIAFDLGVLRSDSLAGRVFQWMSRWTLRSSDLVIALGETMGDRLRQAGARRVTVVHNWADGSAVRPILESESRIRLSNDWINKFIVLYSGNLGLAHEFETVLDAASQMKDESVAFAFVGTGPRLAAVKEGAIRRGLTNVEFHPPVPRGELGDLLAAGDVHLVTLRPGMPGLLVPSKIYGILAAGRPAVYVGPAQGEVHEILSKGCGTCISNGDTDALIATLRVYRDDANRRTKEGTAARALFEARFTRDSQTSRFLDALEDLALA